MKDRPFCHQTRGAGRLRDGATHVQSSLPVLCHTSVGSSRGSGRLFSRVCGQAFSKMMTRFPIPSPHVDPHSAEKKGGQRDLAPPEAVRLQALGCPVLPSRTSVGAEPTPEKRGPVSPTVPLEPGRGWPALDGYVEATAGSPPCSAPRGPPRC